MQTIDTHTKLSREFFDRPTLEVCENIIGKVIVYDSVSGLLSARIVEVEAYIGSGDPACHASRGETERNRVMFGPAGHAYIYLIYGMYNCLNFVTESEGCPSAVLLRGAEPLEGISLMKERSNVSQDWQLLNGPGKFCRSFGLNRDQNGLDLCSDKLYLEERSSQKVAIERSSRIGISIGQEKQWRFYDGASRAVSKTPARKQTKGDLI